MPQSNHDHYREHKHYLGRPPHPVIVARQETKEEPNIILIIPTKSTEMGNISADERPHGMAPPRFKAFSARWVPYQPRKQTQQEGSENGLIR